MAPDFDVIVEKAIQGRASDIHLGAGMAPCCRVDGRITPMSDERLSVDDIKACLKKVVPEKLEQTLEETGELDLPYSIPGIARLRVNVYRQRGTYAIAARVLNPDIPSPEALGVPQAVVECCDKKRGLILFTGPTGSGKSTSLASLIDYINQKYPYHIITLEDPVEYLHKHRNSIVHQREVGPDTLSYANALRAALREDPDVILIGEMRDFETISIAATAAETGHLVFSTLHTVSAVDTVNRIIDVFPPHQQQQIRTQIADILECVVAEQLLPKAGGKGRVAAFEVMLSNSAIQNYIREAKTFQITTVIQTNRAKGMITMDDSLMELYNQGLITRDTAVHAAMDEAVMNKKFMSMGIY